MLRSACRRLVLPTPLSRQPSDTSLSPGFPPGSGAKDSMPDNNAAERALRGVAIGRKAWLFAGSDRGGERAAAMYSLIVTARLNDVDPRAWLADILRRIGDHPASRQHELLPWHWRAESQVIATA